jgi:hypothetical protein
VVFVSLRVARRRTARLELIPTVCRLASHNMERHNNHCSCK